MSVNTESGKYGVPCKFYRAGKPNSCRNGDECYFIHDDSAVPRSRRYSRSNSEDEAQYSNKTHYIRKVAIDPKYKYIAEKAKPDTNAQSVRVTISNPAKPRSRRNSAKTIVVDDPSIYSSLDRLTPEDSEKFQAEEFILGSIPLLPPPLSMA